MNDEANFNGTFAKIYEDDSWSNGSGPGSSPIINAPYINLIEQFIINNNVRKISDIGCGDFQLMFTANLSSVTYHGYDVVPSLIHNNNNKYSSENVSFHEMPTNYSELPNGDLAIVKDVLIHLNNKMSYDLLCNLKTKYKYVIAVNNYSEDRDAYNKEISTGQFRPVDISKAPLNFESVTLLRYSKSRFLDPRYPRVVSAIFHKYIWPGMKHVQLIIGTKAI